MKTMPSLFFLLVAFTVNAQLVFKNANVEKSNISKFSVSQEETKLFKTIDNKETLVATWNQTPSNTTNNEGQNKYKLIVFQQDKEVKITYEIHYSLYRKTNKHIGYIKSTFHYLDKRPTKITEDYFSI